MKHKVELSKSDPKELSFNQMPIGSYGVITEAPRDYKYYVGQVVQKYCNDSVGSVSTISWWDSPGVFNDFKVRPLKPGEQFTVTVGE